MRKYIKQTPVIVSLEEVTRRIFIVRGQRVMLDSDLAALYQIPLKAFNQVVKRNLRRFPSGLMFRLSRGEFNDLKSQAVTSRWGAAPYAFTEQGAAILTTIVPLAEAL